MQDDQIARRRSGVSHIDLNFLATPVTAKQTEDVAFVNDLLRQTKSMTQSAVVLVNMLQTSPSFESSKKRIDWLYLHDQIAALENYFISDMIGGKKDASINDREKHLNEFEHVLQTVSKVDVILPEPDEEEFVEFDKLDACRLGPGKSSFLRGHIRTTAMADGTGKKDGEQGDYPIATLVERHPDTWWLTQLSHELLRRNENNTAEVIKFSHRKLYESVVSDIIKKLCARHPDFIAYREKFELRHLSHKFRSVMAFTAKTFNYHQDVVNYYNSINPQEYPEFTDLSAYTYKALDEVESYIVTTEHEIVRLVKELCDILQTIVEFVLPKLEGVFGIKIDTSDITILLQKINDWWKSSSFRLYRETLFGEKLECESALIVKKHSAGSLLLITERFMGHLTKYDLELPALRAMHPRGVEGPLTPINALTRNVKLMHQLVSSEIHKINKINGRLNNSANNVLDNVEPDPNGFSQRYDQLITKFRGVYPEFAEEKTPQARQRTSSHDQGANTSESSPSSTANMSVRPRSVSKSIPPNPAFFPVDGTRRSPRSVVGSATPSPTSSPRTDPTIALTSSIGVDPPNAFVGTDSIHESASVLSSGQEGSDAVVLHQKPPALSPQTRRRESGASKERSIRRQLLGKSMADPAVAAAMKGEAGGEQEANNGTEGDDKDATKEHQGIQRSQSMPKFVEADLAIAKLFSGKTGGGNLKFK